MSRRGPCGLDSYNERRSSSVHVSNISANLPVSDLGSYCSGLIDGGYARLPDPEPTIPRLDYQANGARASSVDQSER